MELAGSPLGVTLTKTAPGLWINHMELKTCFRNSRMLKRNGSWIYCDTCNTTVAYLCYSTYQHFRFEFVCRCGTVGALEIEHPSDRAPDPSARDLMKIKNRFCCPNDEAPLFSIVEKHIAKCSFAVTCNTCFNSYTAKGKVIK